MTDSAPDTHGLQDQDEPTASAAVEMRRLAGAFRSAADNPPPTPLPARWVEGFTDGLRFGAAALDVIADGNLTPDAIDAAMRTLR